MPIGGALFGLLSARMMWSSHRQRLLARNIANADTPGYAPRDLDEAAFARLADRYAAQRGRGPDGAAAPGPLAPVRTDPAHQASAGLAPARLARAGQARDATFEVAPNGNAVVLEEQMASMAQTALDHRLAADLYRKYLGMVHTALGAPS